MLEVGAWNFAPILSTSLSVAAGPRCVHPWLNTPHAFRVVISTSAQLRTRQPSCIRLKYRYTSDDLRPDILPRKSTGETPGVLVADLSRRVRPRLARCYPHHFVRWQIGRAH